MTDKREIFTMEQGSESWKEIRLAVVTASCFGKVLNSGKGRGDYMKCLADEKRYGEQVDSYSCKAMDDGHIYESYARQYYEAKFDVKVQQVGFILWGHLGCSPDGLIGDDGGLEIKCSQGKSHREILKRQKMPTTHIPQVQSSMWISHRKWWDFVSYSPWEEEEDPFFCQRILRNDNYINNILKPASDRFLQDFHDLIEINDINQKIIK